MEEVEERDTSSGSTYNGEEDEFIPAENVSGQPKTESFSIRKRKKWKQTQVYN